MKFKTKMSFLILLMFMILPLAGCFTADEDGYVNDSAEYDNDDFSAALTKYIEENMANEGLTGAAVAIVNGDEIIFAEGFGYRDVDAGLPVTTETLFHIGSTNKSMTAMLTAILVDEGYFDWDTPVIEIYPDFALENEYSTETVTMRHLLGMQSGIPDYAEDDFDVDNASGRDLFTYIATAPLEGDPGDEFSYSNISASLAGYLDVITAGYDTHDFYNGYAELLTDKVLAPIGMDNAVVRYSDAKRNPNYGKSYYGDGSEAEPEDFEGDPLAPSGTVKANVLDMAAYISTQLNEGVAPNGTRVVSASALKETWQPSLDDYGMGWQNSSYSGYDVISHEGSFDNYLSVIGFVPELEMGFVVLTNSEEAAGDLIEGLPKYVIDYMDE
jgi:CubicO group peptidase (beta-lactamase class C family)